MRQPWSWQAANEQRCCPMTEALTMDQTDMSGKRPAAVQVSHCSRNNRYGKNVLLRKSGFNLPKIQIFFCINRTKGVEDIIVLEPHEHCWVRTELGNPIRQPCYQHSSWHLRQRVRHWYRRPPDTKESWAVLSISLHIFSEFHLVWGNKLGSHCPNKHSLCLFSTVWVGLVCFL